ncbi:MAG: aminoacyl-histidine dipeptidase [Oscillospiraceae bacterium]|nr:aminoacyl-histidine dipeptidase [Oscillospiraceae bacterium]
MGVLSNLEPNNVFSYFEQLCSVPHGSGNTKQISDLCVAFAKEHGLRYRQDEVNNVVIWKDGSAGYESAEPIILQGHIDMVCAKTDDCAKDMAKEGLDVRTDGKTVWAEKTSLGGDDGIAVAMVMAILADDALPHPPIEAVFTVDEEVGMDGAVALDCSDLKAKRLLNIDSEEEGVFTVSCAGGVRMDSVMPGTQKPLSGETGYSVTISGLLGGHSGVEIDKGRGSANYLMGRTLYMAMEAVPGLRVADIRGGEADNVISRDCTAQVAVPAARAEAFEAFIRGFEATLQNEYAIGDPGLTLTAAHAELSAALDAETTERTLHVLFALPQGVQEMSLDFPGLVQTSLNLGMIAMQPDGLHFTYSVRSSIASQKEMLRRKLRSVVEYAGGSVSERGDYPNWQYRKDSAFRELVQGAYRDLNGRDARIDATHGGLECGLFISKIPGLDALSLGPDLKDIHSVRERLDVASTARVYALVCEILRRSK